MIDIRGDPVWVRKLRAGLTPADYLRLNTRRSPTPAVIFCSSGQESVSSVILLLCTVVSLTVSP
jgi:hypothetical protein